MTLGTILLIILILVLIGALPTWGTAALGATCQRRRRGGRNRSPSCFC